MKVFTLKLHTAAAPPALFNEKQANELKVVRFPRAERLMKTRE